MKELILSEKQSIAYEYLEDPLTEELLYGGAAGGGKTVLGCTWQLNRRLMYPETVGGMGRKKLKTLEETTLVTFFRLWEKYFKHNKQGITLKYNSQKHRINFSNDSIIYLQDLTYYPSDPEMIDLGGKEYTDFFADEVTGIVKKPYDIINTRIRHNLINNVPKLYMTGNPAHNWAKFRFVYDEEGNPVKLTPIQKYIQATVYDNPDKEFVKRYIKTLERLPEADRRRLLDGDWMYNPNEAPFLYEFKESNLVDSLEIDTGNRMMLSFDFNYDPTTAVLMQLDLRSEANGGGLNIIKEFKHTGGTSQLCDYILSRLPIDDIRHLLYITGDHSGMSRTSAAGNYTDYQIIKDKFRVSDKRLIDVTTANLRHQESQDLCNYTLMHIPTRISKKGCPSLISDMRFAQVKDGKLNKDRNKGFGMDLMDCFRYGVNALFPNKSKSIKKFENLINPNYYKSRI